MQIIRHAASCPENARGSVIALGNFDGIRSGHMKVISTAVEEARKSGRKSTVMTFEPHPASVVRPGTRPFRLTSLRTKYKRLKAADVDILFLMHFTQTFSQMDGRDFIEKILIRDLQAAHIVIGYDFIFGYQRSGNAELLKEYAEKGTFRLTQCAASKDTLHNETYSSTRIRRLIGEGKIEEAIATLGHHFEITGRVRHGQKMGRKLGFPTLNISLKHYILPPFGVYEAEIWLEGKRYDAIANLGIRPTVNGTESLLEVHVFEYNGDAYGKQVNVSLLRFIRPERKFDSLDALKNQITSDCQLVRSGLGKSHV